MLSTAPKNKTLFVTTNSNPQQDINGHQFHVNQRKIVKSSPNYNLMAFNKSPTYRQDCNIEETKNESLQRSESFSSVKFLNDGERLVSQLCDTSLEIADVKGANQYQNITILTRDKSNFKGNAVPVPSEEGKCEESVSSQIVQLAVEACTVAENIAIANKNRPCFKNIQTICEKTKSNVQKPDAAVANLHSQGVPWVIKNFIFSFVRILDGWKGVKELLCEKHESFRRIETQYYSPQIRDCFFEWQVSTKNMLENIYKTFNALDTGFQVEQQRYKRYSGINLMAIQNKEQKPKQQVKRSSPVPITSLVPSQAQFSQFYAQWQNNNLHPLSQSMSHGNIFSQWNTQQSSKAVPYQTSMHKMENTEFNKPPSTGRIKILQNKEDVKIHHQNVENVTTQNDEVSIKQYNTNNASLENIIQKNIDVKKTNAEGSSFLSNIHNNEVNSPYTGYWLNPTANENKFFNNIHPDGNFGNGINIKCNSNIISLPTAAYQTTIQPNADDYVDSSDVTTVYMNPGSYNLPMNKIKVCMHANTDFGALESLTVHNSTIAKDNISFYPKPIINAYPSLNENNFNIMKKTNMDITNPYSLVNTSSDVQPNTVKAVLKGTDDIFTYKDKEWETAIQLAPKFITTIHQSPEESRTDCQRLYDALENNKHNEIANEINEPSCIESVSWNKISQQFYGGCQSDIEINYLSNSETNCRNISLKSDKNKSDAHPFSTTEMDKHELLNEKSESVDSLEICKTESEFGSTENIKKPKKKNNQNYKFLNRKKSDYGGNGIKKMETILLTLWNMDRNWPLDKELKYTEVVKNVITFPIISDRLKSSYYSDVHQVASDIRMIFYNAYEHLKAHPDEKLKQQVDKMQECFEKLFSEEILNRDKKGNTKKKNEFYNN